MQTQTLRQFLANCWKAIFFLSTLATAVSCSPSPQMPEVFSSIDELELPISHGAREPSLFAMKDRRILISWTEPTDNGYAVKIAIGNYLSWSEPMVVVQSNKLFVNWADFPSVSAFSDGTLVAHWLIENGRSSYEYDINIALSRDSGYSWGQTIVPHRDGAQQQHGFVTLLPIDQNRLMAIWLDGRTYSAESALEADGSIVNAMQLRTTTIDAEGNQSDDTLLDFQTCTCCQTSATITGRGDVLVVYRDRTDTEIRDIALMRMVGGVWSEPGIIHEDGWKIAGCPVNGPAIDSAGEKVAVAWFTGANNVAKVNLAFSTDSGVSFGNPMRIGGDDVAGRVDVLQLEDGSALISWVEYAEAGEILLVCKAMPDTGCEKTQIIGQDETSGSINFPRMVFSQGGVYLAWTQSLGNQLKELERNSTIKMVYLVP